MATKRKSTARKATKSAKKTTAKSKKKTTTAKRKTTTTKKRTTTKKKPTTTRKTTTKKKTSAKKSSAAKKPAMPMKTMSLPQALRECNGKNLTRAQQIKVISDVTGQPKKIVQEIIETAHELINQGLSRDGQISFAGLMKIVVVKKPATKARKGVNPFTGEEMMFKAKPARKVVKIRPLQKIKDMVA